MQSQRNPEKPVTPRACEKLNENVWFGAIVKFRWFVRGQKLRQKLSKEVDRDPHKVLSETHCPRKVPRILWSYWKEGEDVAPDL